MRRDSRYRCDGCLRSWTEVSSGPMLKGDVWARICDQRPRDRLCDECVGGRFKQAYGRELRIDDLKPCPINVISGRYFELAPPRAAAGRLGEIRGRGAGAAMWVMTTTETALFALLVLAGVMLALWAS